MSSLANRPSLGPGDILGEGDSYIYCGLISGSVHDDLTSRLSLADDIFDALYHEVRWLKMYHAAGEVPRLVAVQGMVDVDGSKPLYRHPSDQAPPLLPFSKYVNIVREECEKLISQPLNHVLIQLYRDGKDCISEHSDKTLDITHGSNIVNASFGAQRTMRLRSKKRAAVRGDMSGRVDPNKSEINERTTQRIPMPHNSIFVLGPKTNQIWLHGINADKRMAMDRRDEEKAYGGMRISLTFRNIGTFLSKNETLIWGQGAKNKSKDRAAKVVNGNETETENMIRAFGIENREGESFVWEETYGEGFDVLHFRNADENGEKT